jgi:hypothetical protein
LQPQTASIFKSEAMSALGHVRDRNAVRARVESILAKTDDRNLDRAFAEAFG